MAIAIFFEISYLLNCLIYNKSTMTPSIYSMFFMAPNIFYLRLIFLSCAVIQKIRNNQHAIKTKSVEREKKKVKGLSSTSKRRFWTSHSKELILILLTTIHLCGI